MNNFDVLKCMSEENKDIALSTTIVSIQKSSAGGLVTFGVSDETLHKLIFSSSHYKAVLLCWDSKQFDEIKSKHEPKT